MAALLMFGAAAWLEVTPRAAAEGPCMWGVGAQSRIGRRPHTWFLCSDVDARRTLLPYLSPAQSGGRTYVPTFVRT